MGLLNKSNALALLAGAMCVFGFAPFGIFVIPVLALAVLFALWLRAGSAGAAAWIGFAFGLGLFSAGIGWIYIAMYEYGGMPLLLALFAALLFSAFWALLPALAGYVQARFQAATWLRIALVMPAAWALLEWFRGLLVTGFPWLTLGYAHSDSPLAGYAPLLGIYGVSLAAAVSAGLLALIVQKIWDKKNVVTPAEACVQPELKPLDSGLRRNDGTHWAIVVLLLLWGLGALLRTVIPAQAGIQRF